MVSTREPEEPNGFFGDLARSLQREAAEQQGREIMFAVLDEVASLSACRAQGYRGQGPGKPPRAIQPTDPAGDALGYPYTHAEFTEFAVRRVIERFDFPEEVAEEVITAYVAQLRSASGQEWDEVAVEGPPEPTPPYR